MTEHRRYEDAALKQGCAQTFHPEEERPPNLGSKIAELDHWLHHLSGIQGELDRLPVVRARFAGHTADPEGALEHEAAEERTDCS